MSADLYTFHEAVSHLQEMEEDVLDSHKLVLDQMPKWHQACATLLAMTNEVDYDVDGMRTYLGILLMRISSMTIVLHHKQLTFNKWRTF